MSVIDRLFWRLGRRDREMSTFEAIATGVPPVLDDPVEVEVPDAGIVDAPSLPPKDLLPSGPQVLREVMFAKVLHGWLENRHQTLFPLSVNLRAMDQAQRATLAQMAALALLADRDHGASGTAPERTQAAINWLTAAGAEGDTLQALDDALRDPPAMSTVLDAVSESHLAPQAYVAALVSLNTRDAAGSHLLDYFAARLALPATLVRSANRKYQA